MTSCDSSLILELLEKTEAYLKRIEIYNKRFVCLSLNEWRYAARHFATFNVTHDADEERKAIIWTIIGIGVSIVLALIFR